MKEAITCATDRQFDIVVSDLGLPDGSGCEVMEAVLRLRPIPGIAMSGYGMEEDLKRSAEAGFAEHPTKPISLENLVAAIELLTASHASPP